MYLYLVQHGQAKPKDEDPERPLSDAGVRASEASARACAEQRFEVIEIRHSGKRRARETAEIFAEHLKPVRAIRVVEGLAPNDDPAPVVTALDKETEPVMLVGHLPFLARLAGLLVAGDPDAEVAMFENAGVVRLRRTGKRWAVSDARSP